MAIDTRDRRFSMIGFGSPVPAVLPNPDGTIAAADRAMLIWLYYGLSLEAPVVAVAYLLTLHERSAVLTLKGRGE